MEKLEKAANAIIAIEELLSESAQGQSKATINESVDLHERLPDRSEPPGWSWLMQTTTMMWGSISGSRWPWFGILQIKYMYWFGNPTFGICRWPSGNGPFISNQPQASSYASYTAPRCPSCSGSRCSAMATGYSWGPAPTPSVPNRDAAIGVKVSWAGAGNTPHMVILLQQQLMCAK